MLVVHSVSPPQFGFSDAADLLTVLLSSYYCIARLMEVLYVSPANVLRTQCFSS